MSSRSDKHNHYVKSKMEYHSGKQTMFIHRLILVFCILCSVLPTCGNKRYSSKCFNNNKFASVNLTCDNGTVIHVVEVLGGKHTEDSCTVITHTSMCNEVIGPNWMHYTVCNGKTECDHEVFSRVFRKCNVTAVQVKYECVNESVSLDVCSETFLENNVSNSVIYLKSPGFPSSVATNKECKCNVKIPGNYMKLSILDLMFVSNNSTNYPTFIMNNTNMTLWDSVQEKNKSCPFCIRFREQNVEITQTQNYLQVIYNNKNHSQQNLWIEITGRQHKMITVECNANIEHSTTQISTTPSTPSLPETTSLPTQISSSTTTILSTSLSTSLSSSSSSPLFSSSMTTATTKRTETETSSTININATTTATTTTSTLSSSRSGTLNEQETRDVDKTVIIVVPLVCILVIISVVIGAIIFWKRSHRKKDSEDIIISEMTSPNYETKYDCMNETFDNSNDTGVRIDDYSEISLDYDNKPTIDKITSQATSNNHAGNGVQKDKPYLDDLTERKDPSHEDYMDTSVFSIQPERQLGTNNDYAVVIPKQLRQNKPSAINHGRLPFEKDKDETTPVSSGNGTIDEKMEDQIELNGCSVLKHTENGVRDSVPYMIPADSINIKPPQTCLAFSDNDANDAHIYTLPADAIDIPKNTMSSKCVSERDIKDNEVDSLASMETHPKYVDKTEYDKVHISTTEGPPKCVSPAEMEDNEFYSISTKDTTPECVPDSEMEDNELYNMYTKDTIPKCVPDSEMEDNELYNMSTKDTTPKCVPDSEMEDNELYNMSTKDTTPKCVPDGKMEDN